MADEQSAIILGLSIKSNLCDGKPDKRKQAAQDIETKVREAFSSRTSQQPSLSGLPASTSSAAPGSLGGNQAGHELAGRYVRCLIEDFCRSAWPNRRKGGLIGLASVAIALEHKPVQNHVDQLVPAIITCFSDEDPAVRYSSVEAFYNVAKVARSGILKDLQALFDGLCRLHADVDKNVKDGAQCLDRLVQDIVTESRDFDYSALIPLLTTRIRVLNPCLRQLCLGWIMLLDSVPQVDMISYLPQYLEGLFNILASDNREIRQSTEQCLGELLSEIKNSVQERPARAQRAIANAAPTVARCCRAGEHRPEDSYVRLMALVWVVEFVQSQAKLEGATRPPPEEEPHQLEAAAVAVEDEQQRSASPQPEALSAAGAARAATSSGHHISRTMTMGSIGATSSSAAPAPAPAPGGLRELVPVLLTGALHCLDDGEHEIRQKAEEADRYFRGVAEWLGADLPVQAIVDAVLGAMKDRVGGQERSSAVLLKCFSWAQLMLGQCREQVLRPAVRDRLLDAALGVVLRPDAEVAVEALKLVAHLVASAGRGRSEGVPQLAEEPEPEDAGQLEASTAATSSRLAAAEGSDAVSGDLFASTCHRLFRLMAEDARCLAAEAAAPPAGKAGEAGNSSSPSSRGELVVRRLCDGEDGVDAVLFFATAARAVAEERDAAFAQRLVRVLNWVLLTSRETRKLRARLRDAAAAARRPGTAAGGEGGEVPPLLMQLLLAWFHCPISTLALCLWLHWFELAAEITARLANVPQTLETQAQMNSFVELLESPIFVKVRLQLLDARQPALLRTVLGLVALLPQERALRARLEVVKTSLLLDRIGTAPAPPQAVPKACGALLKRFDEVVDLHGWRKVVL